MKNISKFVEIVVLEKTSAKILIHLTWHAIIIFLAFTWNATQNKMKDGNSIHSLQRNDDWRPLKVSFKKDFYAVKVMVYMLSLWYMYWGRLTEAKDCPV